MPRIAVLGSLNMDLVARAPRFLRPGETLLGHSFHTAPGGKGANQAVAARRLGAHVAMIGRVGDDAFGQALREGLEAEGLDVRHVDVTPSVSTGVALITVDDCGENTIIVVPGANGLVSMADVARAGPVVAQADVLLLQLEVPLPAVRDAARRARESGVAVILNAAPARPVDAGLLSLIDYLIVNETEAAEMASVDAGAPEIAARTLQDMGAHDVVVTLGAAGALLVAAGGATTSVPAFDVACVDTTAAGDAFVGAFAVALAEGLTPDAALRVGNAAGALAVTSAGAQPSLPTRAAVDALQAARR